MMQNISFFAFSGTLKSCRCLVISCAELRSQHFVEVEGHRTPYRVKGSRVWRGLEITDAMPSKPSLQPGLATHTHKFAETMVGMRMVEDRHWAAIGIRRPGSTQVRRQKMFAAGAEPKDTCKSPHVTRNYTPGCDQAADELQSAVPCSFDSRAH